MDPTLVSMISSFLEKTGSVSAESQKLFDRMGKYIDQQDNTKTASVSANRDEAVRLAQRMSDTRLYSGVALIEGREQVKQASTLLGSHEGALKALDLILNAVQSDRQKTASLEPGRVDYHSHASGSGGDLTAKEELLQACGISIT